MKYNLVLALIFFFLRIGAQGLPIENLEWAPDSAYIIRTTTGGEPVYVSQTTLGALINTDDQQITSFTYNNSTQVLTISLEGANSVSTSLNALRQILTKTGNILQLTNGGGSINLAEYLDNTDDQALMPMTWDSMTNTLTIALENGGAVSKQLSIVETDPSIGAHIKNITIGDIADWNNDLVNDADSDPTNELDTLTITQPGPSNMVNFGGNVTKGTIHVIKAVTVGADGNQSLTIGTDDQKIQVFSFDTNTDQLTLTLENGGTKVVTLEGVGDVCEDYSGITASSYDPPSLTFSGGVDVYLNGVLMTLKATPGHINEFFINNQNIQFYENLETTDALRVCVK